MHARSFRCRDFIVSEDGLVFSVVSDAHPKDRVIAFLRYIPKDGGLVKAGSTEDSFKFLEENFPEYAFHSDAHDAKLQAVPIKRIREVIHPSEFLQKLSKTKNPDDYQEKIIRLAKLLSRRSHVPQSKFGVTGSVLVGAHTASSDVDVVVYGRRNFAKVREVIGRCEPPLAKLDESVLKEMYAKRFPSTHELSFPEFRFHELRKSTTAVFEGRRFHILLVKVGREVSESFGEVRFRRVGRVRVSAKVVDDSRCFDYPAVYGVSGTYELDGKRYNITELASYTHTYVGQVFRGEVAQASGILEQVSSREGAHFRVLVGSTREAAGEYIKLFNKR